MNDPVIVALLNRLPSPGTYWPLDERTAWLRAVEAAFDLVYGREPALIEIGRTTNVSVRVNGQDTTFREEDVLKVGKPVEIHAPVEQHTAPAAPMVDPPKAEPEQEELPRKNLGGAPSKAGRPDGIPTNFEMAKEAIEHHGGKAGGTQIRNYVREKYWAGAPDSWSAALYDLVNARKLARNGINFIVREAATPDVPQTDKPQKTVLTPRQPVVQPVPTPRPASKPVKFDHDGRATHLATMREYVVAGKLRAAMGKGHVAEAHLASEVIGSNTETNRDVIRLLCRGMNESLAEVGLVIEHHPGYGLLMKELA